MTYTSPSLVNVSQILHSKDAVSSEVVVLVVMESDVLKMEDSGLQTVTIQQLRPLFIAVIQVSLNLFFLSLDPVSGVMVACGIVMMMVVLELDLPLIHLIGVVM
jgi:hypothetical protein